MTTAANPVQERLTKAFTATSAQDWTRETCALLMLPGRGPCHKVDTRPPGRRQQAAGRKRTGKRA